VLTRETCPGKKAQVQCVLKATADSPNQVLFIDDSKRNITVCSDLGVVCFLFQNSLTLFRKKQAAKETWNKIMALIDNEFSL
jgi:hypothetical protein